LKLSRLLPVLVVALVSACGKSSSSSGSIAPVVIGPGEVDLGVDKTVDLPTALVGESVTFTLTIASDPAGADATGVVLTDLLPGGLDFVSANPGQGTYDAGTGLWSVGDVASGASATLAITANVTAPSGTVITNVASGLVADQNDPIGGNDSDSVDVVVADAVDLGVTKVVDAANPNEGDTVTFTITLTHAAGTVPATGVSLVDALPAGLSHADDTPSQGSFDVPSGVWSVGTLAPGAVATLELEALVEPGTATTTLTNTVGAIQLDQADRNPGNDSAAAAVVVKNDTDVQVTKVVDQASPKEGTTVTFTISVLNVGPALATGVQIDDLLPAGTTHVSNNPSAGFYDSMTGAWTIPALLAGAPNIATLDVFAQIDGGTAGTTIQNTATLTALDQNDLNAGNDSDSASVTPAPSTDLAVTVTVDDAAPVRRQPVAFEVTIANVASLPATGVSLAINVPAGLTLEAAAPSTGSFDAGTGAWSVGSVDVGQSHSLELVASVDPTSAGTTLTTTALVSALDQPDPDSSNDGAAVAVTVVADSVDIVRDAYGTPHVFASSDQGALFGAGYAAAELRLSQMLRTRLAFRGQMAQYFGRGANDEFLANDRLFRAMGIDRHTKRVLQEIDPETRSLLRAYADGVNAYRTSPGAMLHPVLVAAGATSDVLDEPWLASDCIGVWLQLSTRFGPSALPEAKALQVFETKLANDYGDDVQAALDALASVAHLDDSAAVVLQSDVPPAVQQAMADYADFAGMTTPPPAPTNPTPPFSHAWAVSGAHTADGHAILVTDPRYPIDRPTNLMEMHIKGETFEVRGIMPPGSVITLVGATRNVAWGGSALGHDQNDLFRLDIDSQQPGGYLLDGTFRPWDLEETEIILVAGEPSVTLIYRESFFGPVVTPVVTDAKPGEQYALRSTPLFAPDRDASIGHFAMYRAADIDEFALGLAEWIYPTVNVVFADTAGRIGYWANGAIPARSPQQPYYRLGGDVAQLGRNASDDWIGLIPHELLPHVKDPASGVLFTANHMPVGSWYPILLGMTTGSSGDTNRSRRLRELLAADGPLYDVAELEAYHRDVVNTAQRDLVALALEVSQPLSVDARKALTELEGWYNLGAKKSAEHHGVLLAERLDITLRSNQGPEMFQAYGGGLAGTHNFLKTRVAELVGGGVPSFQPFEIQWLDDRLAEAWGLVTTNDVPGIAPGASWLTYYSDNILTLKTPAFRAVDGLPALDPADVLEVLLVCEDKGTLTSQSGQAYTLVVPLGDPDSSRSILAFGDGEPGTLHDQDQLSLYTAQALKPAPLTRSEIASQVGTVVESTLTY
jgi:uncharacterized repeat protein (TIGR01451 family)